MTCGNVPHDIGQTSIFYGDHHPFRCRCAGRNKIRFHDLHHWWMSSILERFQKHSRKWTVRIWKPIIVFRESIGMFFYKSPSVEVRFEFQSTGIRITINLRWNLHKIYRTLWCPRVVLLRLNQCEGDTWYNEGIIIVLQGPPWFTYFSLWYRHT